MPPAGIVMANVSVDPDKLPVRLPLNVTLPPDVFATTDPETGGLFGATFHVIVPDPDESDAEPE